MTELLTLPGFGAPEGRVYSRPTLQEIQGRPLNGLTAVSTFSGAGGSSLGLRMAGWSVPYAVEFVEEARKTYAANSPKTFIDRRDIRFIEPRDILDRLDLAPGELDLFEGSPPCASFSMAGKREKGWGETRAYSDTKQRTDDLFGEWLRLIEGLRPRAILAENVPGMIIGDSAKAYTREVIREIRSLGYQVRAEILNSAWYRVPQTRRRLIFLGYREDLAPDRIEFPPPSDEAPFTLAEALASVPEGDPDIEAVSLGAAVGRTRDAIVEARREGREFDPRSFPCQRCERPLTDEGGHTVTKESGDGIVLAATCADGGKATILKDYFMLTIPALGKPCPTLTAQVSSTAASVAHPTERRFFTPSEALAISGFPPDFILTGDALQRGERVGRAVTPPLYEAIGRTIAEVLQEAAS